jgi:hypothetical protein
MQNALINFMPDMQRIVRKAESATTKASIFDTQYISGTMNAGKLVLMTVKSE